MRKKAAGINKQQGFASIVVVMVFLVVLSLLSVGFAYFANQEQQNTLSLQLGTEAQYAAESAINNAEKDIMDGKIANTTTATSIAADNTNCMKFSLFPTGSYSKTDSTLNTNNGVYVSCLLVDLTPPDLSTDDIVPGTEWSQVFTPTDASGNNSVLSSLTINWGSHDAHNNYDTNASDATGGKLFDEDTWNSASNHLCAPLPAASTSSNQCAPLLQVSITPFNGDGTTVTRSNLLTNAMNLFLYPLAKNPGGTNAITYQQGVGLYQSSQPAAANNGAVLAGNCTGTGKSACGITINGLDQTSVYPSGYKGSFLITVIPYYDAADIDITGNGVSPGTPVGFAGQDEIDVTAHAHNTVKRLVVTIKNTNSSIVAPYQIQAQNVCKRMETYTTGKPISGSNTDYINPDNSTIGSPSATDTNPCDLE